MIEQDLMTGTRFTGAILLIATALLLTVANRGKVQSAIYNRSRWLIIICNLLISAHMIVQFLGHYRETSISTCWFINIAFFVIIAPLYYLASVNILYAGHNLKNRYIHMAMFYILCYTILGAGYVTGHLINDQQPWMTTTAIVAFILFCYNCESTYTIIHGMRNAHSALDNDELEERHRALRFLTRSMQMVMVFSLPIPWWTMISLLPIISILSLGIFGSLLWYSIEFYIYGRQMEQVMEVNDEIFEVTAIDEHPVIINNTSQHSVIIDKWIAERHFTDPNITIDQALQQMNLSINALNNYLEQFPDTNNFRKWLSFLRIEEAKRLMREHPEYTLQAVAEACGYAHLSTLSRAFKVFENVAPKEWHDNHKRNNSYFAIPLHSSRRN